MRNLKKILALVLAMVMTFSVMATANAFTDSANVDETYEEAVEVLAALKVFEGYEDGSFKPQAKITRAEVAAIIYRIVTGDVKDKQVGIYADYNKFDDVKSTAWYAGYVNFCANAEYILGYGDGNFGPNDNVTGYQALAMILRAIGYDKNGEFTGSAWQVQTAAVGKKLGITDNVTAGTLGTAATREVVAEILFQTILVPQVDYTVAFGYTTYGNESLGWDTFKLAPYGDVNDTWGRPGFQWNANGKKLVVINEDPIVTYTTAVTECDLAKAAGLKKDTTFDLYVNGAIKSNLPVQILDTVDTLGAQGRITEVYEDEIVMIDTFLAKVTATADAKFDKNGHQVAPYTITLTVYDNAEGNTVVLTDADAAFGYTAGDFVLVNAYTATGDRDGAGLVANVANTNEAVYGEIIGLAKSEVGAQSVIWYNAAKHTVNDVTYDDACEFNKNDAKLTTVNYTWYFDQFGNVIGAFEIATKYDYAVLTKLWWAGDAATGLGKAMGTLKYMDGTENTVEIAKIGGKTTTYAIDNLYGVNSDNFFVATYIGTNAAADGLYGWIDGNLLRVYTKSNGAVKLDVVMNAAGTAHTEITAKVYNKNGYIGDKALKVDTTTMFLVGTPNAAGVYSYTTYTGINEIPSFTAKDAIVDYVLGSNGVAKYVYIIGTPDSATANDHVLITNTGYTATLKSAGGVSYWEVNLYTLEGLVTVKTKTEAVKNELTNPANVNNLYYLTYTDGYATGFRKVTNTPVNYTGSKYDALILNATYANDVVEADTSYGADYRWNVTESTVVVGELAADMTNKIVYVLYDNDMNVQKIYIIDTPATEVNPPVYDDPTEGTVKYVAYIYDDAQLVATLNASGDAPAGTYAGQGFEAVKALYWDNFTATTYQVVMDNSTVTVKAGETVTLTYIIDLKD